MVSLRGQESNEVRFQFSRNRDRAIDRTEVLIPENLLAHLHVFIEQGRRHTIDGQISVRCHLCHSARLLIRKICDALVENTILEIQVAQSPRNVLVESLSQIAVGHRIEHRNGCS